MNDDVKHSVIPANEFVWGRNMLQLEDNPCQGRSILFRHNLAISRQGIMFDLILPNLNMTCGDLHPKGCAPYTDLSGVKMPLRQNVCVERLPSCFNRFGNFSDMRRMKELIYRWFPRTPDQRR